jgi:DNA-nicking Smr family endonuclease
MSGNGSRKGRRLSGEEHALWDSVTRSVKPLRRRAPKADAGIAPPDEEPPVRPPRRPAAASPALPPKPVSPPPLAPLDRRTRQKIARGRQEIDGRIDLHGLTQAQAHAALLRFLRSAQAKGGRVVLVITGKGASTGAPTGAPTGERGVLRRQVPLWLALPDFRDCVVGFDAAAIGHGGDGALYVRLRKSRG